MISLEEFKKLEIRIGEILSAEKVPDTDKLLKLDVDFGSEKRQIISGIAAYVPEPADLIGKKVAFAYNLEPRVIRGFESQGMILAVGDLSTELGVNDTPFALLEAPGASPGARVK